MRQCPNLKAIDDIGKSRRVAGPTFIVFAENITNLRKMKSRSPLRLPLLFVIALAGTMPLFSTAQDSETTDTSAQFSPAIKTVASEVEKLQKHGSQPSLAANTAPRTIRAEAFTSVFAIKSATVCNLPLSLPRPAFLKRASAPASRGLGFRLSRPFGGDPTRAPAAKRAGLL